MSKIKAYATATGDRNSYILLQPGSEIPHGYTGKVPPLPVDGFKVTWLDDDWHQVPVEQDEVTET